MYQEKTHAGQLKENKVISWIQGGGDLHYNNAVVKRPLLEDIPE